MANEVVNLRTTVPGMKTAINDVVTGRAAADASTAAIQGLALASDAYRFLQVVGGNGAGGRTCTGARVGDQVVAVWSTANATTFDVTSQFETSVLVINTVNQLAGSNLTGAPVGAIIRNKQGV
jgi:ABC-type uncharacterized transport system ATPase component